MCIRDSWCAVRRLNQGRFVWPGANADTVPALTRAQFDALVLGLPWQRLEHMPVSYTHLDVYKRQCPFMRADWIRLMTAAARWPARKLPANNQLPLPMAIGLI